MQRHEPRESISAPRKMLRKLSMTPVEIKESVRGRDAPATAGGTPALLFNHVDFGAVFEELHFIH